MAGKSKLKKTKMSLMERHRQARLLEMALSSDAEAGMDVNKDKNPKQLKRKFKHQSSTSWHVEECDVLDEPGKFVKRQRINSKMVESPESSSVADDQTTSHSPTHDMLREKSPTESKKRKGIEFDTTSI